MSRPFERWRPRPGREPGRLRLAAVGQEAHHVRKPEAAIAAAADPEEREICLDPSSAGVLARGVSPGGYAWRLLARKLITSASRKRRSPRRQTRKNGRSVSTLRALASSPGA